MLYSIAVTTDFSTVSRQAFSYARQLAEKVNARLSLVHVLPAPEVVVPWQVVEATPEAARQRLAHAESRLLELIAGESAFSGFHVTPRVLVGEPATSLEHLQRQEQVDLIVVASHGATSAEGYPLGSFASRLIQLATSAVLVLPVFPGGSTQAMQLFPPRRLLVPHDFSRPSSLALEWARNWAAAFEARVKLLHVVDPGASPEGYLLGTSETVADHFERLRAEAQHRLAEIARRDWEGIAVDVEVAVGRAPQEILRAATELRADLILMAGRGMSSIQRLSLGSVAERVIHGARCPTVVLRQPQIARSLSA